MYINDITNVIDVASQIGMFADDVALWTTPTDADVTNMEIQHEKLQESLNKIALWCNKWKLLLSQSKTQYIVFKKARKRKYPQNLTVTLNGNTIQQTDKVIKYCTKARTNNHTI